MEEEGGCWGGSSPCLGASMARSCFWRAGRSWQVRPSVSCGGGVRYNR